MRAAAVVSTAAILLLAGCSNPEAAVEQAELAAIGAPRVPAPEPSRTDPSELAELAEPAALTEADARRILTELERNNAIFWRWLIDSEVGEQPPDWARGALELIYLPSLIQPLVDGLVQAHEDLDGSHPTLVVPYGQYRPADIVLLRNDPSCPLIDVTWDGTEVEGPEVRHPRVREFIALIPVTLVGATDSTLVYNSIFDVDETTWEDIEGELTRRNLC